MRVDFYFNGIEISSYTRDQMKKKLSKITTKIPNNTPVKISFEDSRSIYRTHLQISLRKKEIIGSGESENILSSLDQAISRVDRQYGKYHDRMNSVQGQL